MMALMRVEVVTADHAGTKRGVSPSPPFFSTRSTSGDKPGGDNNDQQRRHLFMWT